jgi:FSR family fosmidomycin resistance protein-like MFS transporter
MTTQQMTAPASTRKGQGLNILFSLGHFAVDINHTALSALLPFLIAAYNYDYATAAALVAVSNIFGSLVQPLLGDLADKRNLPWIMPVGLLLAGGGMAFTGVIHNFLGLCLAVMVSGLGVAAYHPQAARMVNKASSRRTRGRALSVFSFGGNMGATFGPIILTASIAAFGIRGTLTFWIPELVVAGLMLLAYRSILALDDADRPAAAPARADEAQPESQPARDQWRAFWKMCVAMFGRSIIYAGLATFLALHWSHDLGQSQAAGSLALSVYFAVGAACTLIGGQLADRLGPILASRIGFAILLPGLVLMAASHSLVLAWLALVACGCGISLVYSPMVMLGQSYLPCRVGFASGITLGLSVSIGGILAPILGTLADNLGLTAALTALAVISVIPLAATFFFEEPQNAL